MLKTKSVIKLQSGFKLFYSIRMRIEKIFLRE